MSLSEITVSVKTTGWLNRTGSITRALMQTPCWHLVPPDADDPAHAGRIALKMISARKRFIAVTDTTDALVMEVAWLEPVLVEELVPDLA